MTVPRILTNKTVLTGLQKSLLKDSSLFTPILGAAAKMGKIAQAPALASTKMAGGFKADINAVHRVLPGVGGPNTVLKKFVR